MTYHRLHPVTFENSFTSLMKHVSSRAVERLAKFNRFADTEFHQRRIDMTSGFCAMESLSAVVYRQRRWLCGYCASGIANFPTGLLNWASYFY